MKKFAAIMLALLMVMGLSVTAMADENPQISVTDDRTYDVYQIFVGDLADSKLSNVKWGKNGSGTKGQPVDETVLNALKSISSTASDTTKLETILTYVNLEGEAYDSVSKTAPLSVPTGYYLLKDTTILGAGQEKSLYVVEVVDSFTVSAKAGEVTSEKKVKEKNDSTGAETAWQDTASYDVGDAVPFKLSATITSKYANYEKYYLAFHDTLSAGLTFNSTSVVVKVGETTIDSSKYTVTATTNGFDVVFADLKLVTEVQAGSTITVEYTATLNAQADMGNPGNENKLKVEYSNNPSDSESGTPSKGETPEDKVVVFTYELIVNKVNENNQPLQGAGFTLYKKIKDTSVEGGYKWEAVGTELVGGTMTQFTWERLDAGNYKLSETTTPAGYNTMADIEFEIKDEVNSTPALIKLESVGLTSTADLTAGSLTASITNKQGTVLPETGAHGTMLFIMFGSALAIAAAVLLITRKKMSVYED